MSRRLRPPPLPGWVPGRAPGALRGCRRTARGPKVGARGGLRARRGDLFCEKARFGVVFRSLLHGVEAGGMFRNSVHVVTKNNSRQPAIEFRRKARCGRGEANRSLPGALLFRKATPRRCVSRPTSKNCRKQFGATRQRVFLPGAFPRAHTAWRVSARTHDARRKTPNGSSFRRREVGFKNKVKDPRMPRTAYHVLH